MRSGSRSVSRSATSPFRRWTASVLLLCVAAFAVEPGIGAIRDGEVNHESAATAATHAALGDFSHAHHDRTPPSQSAPGTGHQHGTLNDHCTHQHSVVPAAALAVAPDPRPERQPLSVSPVHPAGSSADFFHPPRA